MISFASITLLFRRPTFVVGCKGRNVYRHTVWNDIFNNTQEKKLFCNVSIIQKDPYIYDHISAGDANKTIPHAIMSVYGDVNIPLSCTLSSVMHYVNWRNFNILLLVIVWQIDIILDSHRVINSQHVSSQTSCTARTSFSDSCSCV